jgi:hypothetical protein
MAMKGTVNKTQNPVEYLRPKTALTAADTAYSPLVYQQGPVLTAPELIAFYWGGFTQAEIDGMQSWLQAFAGYLSDQDAPAAQEQPILQYGTFGATLGTHYADSSAPPSATDTDVQNKITALQSAGNLPGFGPQRLFLVFTKGVQFSGYGAFWCAYHGTWGSGQYYAICPYPSAGGCVSDTPIQSWQSVTSHEILEAATDPTLGGGWVESDGEGGYEEGGDSCAWLEVNLPFGTVQMFADNLQSACSAWTVRETSSISAFAWAPNRLDAFARGTDGAMYHKWWDGSKWDGWESLGGQIMGAPSAVACGDNRFDVFARGTDGAMYHKWLYGANWGGWESLGGIIIGSPNAVSWSANRLDIFALGTDGAMYHNWWDGSNWGGWESLGGVLVGPPASVAWGPNRLDAFMRGNDGAMYHKWWDGSNWGGWESLGGEILCTPAVASWAANRLDVFARGPDGAMYHKWWDGSNWGGWESLGGNFIGQPSVVSWGPNRLDVFARGPDGAMYHKWWDGSNWGGWVSLGGQIVGAPVAVSWGPNRLDVFARGTDGAMYHKWWDGSNWGGWVSLGGQIT